ncbi:MAG: hypothetical protein QOH12_348 [Solirubrobacteraceae bacterium]|jgi:hypothetical protein|nr:hypothetical protein [Solirubrobacteraceae bacterium]
MPKTLAAATVDLLLHHARVLLSNGPESYRLTQATAGKGVMPVTRKTDGRPWGELDGR